jgi:hypothetical protein
MYPGTQFNWYDESFISNETPVTVADDAPLFMAVSSFDKGPENFIEVGGQEFNQLFGTMNFFKHGQNALQLQNIINAGGRLLVKRVVASDSKLANIVFVANVTAVQKEIQKTNDQGQPLYWTTEEKTAATTEVTDWPVMLPVYIDADGNETTQPSDNPVLSAKISSEAKTFENVTGDMKNARESVDASALELLSVPDVSDRMSELTTTSVFPLFTIVDNGRGASSKAIRIEPDYSTSRGSGHMFYNFKVYEGNTTTEDETITVDPTVIYSNTSYRLDPFTCTQVIGEVNEVVFEKFIEKLADISLIDANTLRGYDVVFAKDNKGSDIPNIIIDNESIDLNASNGVALKSGDNGSFGDAPAADPESDAYAAWEAALLDVWQGNVTSEIYDVDQHKVYAVLDANLPASIKAAIADLVGFRQDCVFFRDLGVGHYTFSEISGAKNDLPEIPEENRKFVADYATSYQVKDPVTQKNIEVTMLYDLATNLVSHLANRANAPVAGIYNGMVLASAIKGTENFKPVITPKVNQKQAMEDLHVNYAIFEGNDLVIQSSYTCQDTLSQLSFVNNVLGIQEVLRAVRTACPINRFSLANGSDLSNYAKNVTNVLDNYTGRFDVLEFEYTANKLQAQQKIFYASIRFAFLNWAQSEIFNVYAINNQ